MDLAISRKGWTVVDCDDGRSVCGVSVLPPGRGRERPQVVAVAEQGSDGAGSDTAAFHGLIDQLDRALPTLVTLSRQHYGLRVMPEPAVPPREMQASLRWSLSTEAEDGAGLDDFNLDWMPIPTEEQLPSRARQVYAVTTPKAWLAERVAAWRQAGIRPKVVDIRETALRNIAAAMERGNEGLCLVSVDRGGVGMVFTHRGSLFLDRYIELPQDELAAADAAQRARLFERVAMQLMRSVDVIARSFPFMPVSRVLVAPETVGLREYLAEHLSLAVEALNLERVFNMAKVPALANSAQMQARCLVALGATLRGLKAA